MALLCPHCGEQELPDSKGEPQACSYCGQYPATAWLESPYVVNGVDMRLVAKLQRRLQGLILVTLFFDVFCIYLLAPIPRGASISIIVFFLVLHIAGAVVVARLIAVIRKNIAIAILPAVLMLAPCINLVLMFLVNQSAIVTLRKVGLNKGFKGFCSDKEVVRRLNPMLCRECGYNLTGNISGRCPECGTELPRESLEAVRWAMPINR